MGMRQLMMGAVLLGAALMITFAAASVLQGMAVANRTAAAEPFAIEKITPASTATRGLRNEPGRSVVLASRRTEL
jgi:hypothetical protein